MGPGPLLAHANLSALIWHKGLAGPLSHEQAAMGPGSVLLQALFALVQLPWRQARWPC